MLNCQLINCREQVERIRKCRPLGDGDQPRKTLILEQNVRNLHKYLTSAACTNKTSERFRISVFR
jgi:hypothetical protein